MSEMLEKWFVNIKLYAEILFLNFRCSGELPCPFTPSGIRCHLRCKCHVHTAVNDEAIGGDGKNSASVGEQAGLRAQAPVPALGGDPLGARPRNCWFLFLVMLPVGFRLNNRSEDHVEYSETPETTSVVRETSMTDSSRCPSSSYIVVGGPASLAAVTA